MSQHNVKITGPDGEVLAVYSIDDSGERIYNADADDGEATHRINKDLTVQMLILREANKKHREDLEFIAPFVAQG